MSNINFSKNNQYAWYLQEKAKREKQNTEQAEEVSERKLLSAAPEINTFGLTDKEKIEHEKTKFKDFYVEYLVLCKGEKDYNRLKHNKEVVLNIKDKLETDIEKIASHYKETAALLEKFRIYVEQLKNESEIFFDWIKKVYAAQKYHTEVFNKYYNKTLKAPEEYIREMKQEYSEEFFQSLKFSLDAFEYTFKEYLKNNPLQQAENVLEIEQSLKIEYTDGMKNYFHNTAQEFLKNYENLLKAPLDIRVEVYTAMQNIFDKRMEQLGQHHIDFEDEPLNDTQLDKYCPNDVITL